MKSPIRAIGLALAIGLMTAAPASAGQLVYNSGDEIHVVNDDGSGDRVLITPGDIPGGAQSVYDPWVQPGGTTVVFAARTEYGLWCGFRCVGVYKWDNGAITRLSGGYAACPKGNLCAGLDTGPRITSENSTFYYDQVYSEPSSSGTFNAISQPMRAPATPGGGANAVELTGACPRPSDFTPAPGNPSDYVYVDCAGGSDSGYAIRRGSGGTSVAFDDGQPSGLAWRPDGAAIADSENGDDAGIWTIPLDGSAPKRLVNLTWDWDHSSSSASPAYVGNDRVAYVYGDDIRIAPTSCTDCSADQTALLLHGDDVKGIAWTAQTLPVVTAGGGQQQPGGGTTPPQGGGTTPQGGGSTPAQQQGGGTTTTGGLALAPRKAKIKAALKGLAIPFTATGAGTLKISAVLDAKTARKLGLGKKAITVATGSAKAQAGSASVVLEFNKRHAKKLGKAKTLKLALTGSFTPASGAAQKVAATVTLAR